MACVLILREQNAIVNNILPPPITFRTMASRIQNCDISRWHFKARKMDNHILLTKALMNEYPAKRRLCGDRCN